MEQKITVEFTIKEINIIYNTIISQLQNTFKDELYCITYKSLEDYYLLLKKLKQAQKDGGLNNEIDRI